MTRIKILPENLSNKIAAGEVVERPASVVKELVENSIDAGASRIVIEVEQGGRKKIRIYDDGEGMSEEDALLSLERYATSKISSDEDLFSISTLGFRGEAIPSIASVSHFSILTRQKDSDAGVSVIVKGGKLIDVKKTGSPQGTEIKVEHLFYNIPARRKFLKTVNTEMGHVLEVVSCLALGNPDVYFKLVHNGKSVKEWPGGNLESRVLEVLGNDFKGNLHPVKNGSDGVFVKGFAGSPDITRSNSSKIYTFVNGRYIKDRSVIYAIYDGYANRVMKGRYPGTVLFINLPFDMVDVNVHPTKHEVRFVNSGAVISAVKEGIESAVASEDRIKWKAMLRKPGVGFSSSPDIKIKSSEKISKFYDKPASPKFSGDLKSVKQDLFNIENKDEKPPVVKEDSNEYSLAVSESFFYSSLNYIGQLRNTYILCESEEGLILIDQHAAHERVRFEALLSSYKQSKINSQTLMLPIVVDLGIMEAEKMMTLLHEFKQFGLEISHYGGRSFAVHAVPVILADADIEAIVRDIASSVKRCDATAALTEIIEDVLIMMACHSSVRASQKLTKEEVASLFKSLDNCKNSSRCPHGRPVWVKLGWEFMEKSFKRRI